MGTSITSTEDPAPSALIYRAYRTNAAGGFVSAEIIRASSDDEAMDTTSKMLNGHGIDLWERARFLARFPPLRATEGG